MRLYNIFLNISKHISNTLSQISNISGQISNISGQISNISGQITNLSTLTSLDALHPVGSIYISVNSTNPGTIFGGTWEQIEDTFLLSAGSTYTAGATGGEATHTLTVNEMPSHTHTFKKPVLVYHTSGDGTISSGSYNVWIGSDRAGTGQNQVNDTGSSQAHNNMPPYLVVYMWKRTA